MIEEFLPPTEVDVHGEHHVLDDEKLEEAMKEVLKIDERAEWANLGFDYDKIQVTQPIVTVSAWCEVLML